MSARLYNGAPLKPQDVDSREAALLLGGIGALAAANLWLALKGRTVVCKIVRRAFRLDHPDPKVRRRGWFAFDAALAGGVALFRHHVRHPWRDR